MRAIASVADRSFGLGASAGGRSNREGRCTRSRKADRQREAGSAHSARPGHMRAREDVIITGPQGLPGRRFSLLAMISEARGDHAKMSP